MIQRGDRIKLSHPTSDGGHVTFAAIVRSVDDGYAWVEIPPVARRMPFPPLGGKRFGRYLISKIEKAVIR